MSLGWERIRLICSLVWSRLLTGLPLPQMSSITGDISAVMSGRHWIVDPHGPLTPDGRRGSAVSLLTIPSIRYQIRAATGGDRAYEEILALAAAGDPMSARVVEEAARALGTLVAQISDFVMPQRILLAGEGVGLMDVARATVEETVREHRHPLAAPVDLETKASDFHDRARGAAVLAIKVLVLGSAEA